MTATVSWEPLEPEKVGGLEGQLLVVESAMQTVPAMNACADGVAVGTSRKAVRRSRGIENNTLLFNILAPCFGKIIGRGVV